MIYSRGGVYDQKTYSHAFEGKKNYRRRFLKKHSYALDLLFKLDLKYSGTFSLPLTIFEIKWLRVPIFSDS